MDQKEEHKIDLRVPGLSHAVVKEAEHLRVQELVKKIENHLHREVLHANLQQNNVYKPIQQKFEGDDPGIGRNYTKSTMFFTVFFIGIKELCTALADKA